jgi:hypothetical protein
MNYYLKGRRGAVTFKTFIKSAGLDAVVYSKLTQKEKRIWNGLNTYENRVVLEGKFAPKTLTENPTIKKFALDRNETLKQYIEENAADILKFTNSGIIERVVNSKSLHDFINNHKGQLIFEGNPIDKKEFLLKMDIQRAEIMSGKSVPEILYYFEVKENGKVLNFKKIKIIKSPEKIPQPTEEEKEQ